MEFTQKLDITSSSICGLHVEVMEGIILELIGIPRIGVIWFRKKAFIQQG
jgi:hypothetical protein